MSASDPMPTPSEPAADVASPVKPPGTRALTTRRSMDAKYVAAGTSRRLKHGVYSVQAVQAEVLDELGILFARAPWLDARRDGIIAEQMARLMVRLRRLDAAIIEDPTSVSLTSLAARTESQLLRTAEALGLSPRAAAALGIAKLDGAAKLRAEAEKAMQKYAPKRRRAAR